jgi:hypothetical protein
MKKLDDAIKIDFAGKIAGYTQAKEFDKEIVDLIRKGSAGKTVVVIDTGYNLPGDAPHVVRDHLNFTGSNPLVGPNHECGERFPIVNGIYLSAVEMLDPKKTLPLSDPFTKLPSGIAAGLKPDTKPTAAELDLIKTLGADFYCYNLVPAMIVAAHAGLKVFGLLVPPGATLEPNITSHLKGE